MKAKYALKTAIGPFAFALIIATFLVPSVLVAQTRPASGRNYNPATVESLQGKVTAVDQATMNRRGGMGVHLTLQTDTETIPVHLGPSWFMKKQSLQIQSGDAITVTGSRVTLDGKPAILAAEIQKAGKRLKLRDTSGIPVWSGRGPNSR